jgi:Holliday junction DNA helicase RuvA
LLLELKGKLGADLFTPVSAAGGNAAHGDILNACWHWAIPIKKPAQHEIGGGGCGVSDGIKLALKALSKG